MRNAPDLVFAGPHSHALIGVVTRGLATDSVRLALPGLALPLIMGTPLPNRAWRMIRPVPG
jgi:hypothetical protein